MIRVFYSPQINDRYKVTYKIEGEIITAYLTDTFPEVAIETTDVFDFTNLTNGMAEKITSDLAINLVGSVGREEGILYVELLNFIKDDATEFERFPEWIEVY